MVFTDETGNYKQKFKVDWQKYNVEEEEANTALTGSKGQEKSAKSHG